MSRYAVLLRVLRQGEELANAEAWKKGQITVNVLVPFLAAVVAALQAWGLEIPITHDQLVTVAGAILVVANLWLTPATSKRVGTKPRRKTPPAGRTEAE